MDADPGDISEQAKVEDWREHILIEAGYPADDAIELSRRNEIDLHRAVELLLAGCDIALAVEILR